MRFRVQGLGQTRVQVYVVHGKEVAELRSSSAALFA